MCTVTANDLQAPPFACARCGRSQKAPPTKEKELVCSVLARQRSDRPSQTSAGKGSGRYTATSCTEPDLISDPALGRISGAGERVPHMLPSLETECKRQGRASEYSSAGSIRGRRKPENNNTAIGISLVSQSARAVLMMEGRSLLALSTSQ